MSCHPIGGVILLTAALLPGLMIDGQSRPSEPSLERLDFLLGEWEAVADQAGATGGSTFTRGVQGHVVVRMNYSNTPAHGDQPASRHDDLMVIYSENGLVKADYFDNEGHVIRYTMEPGEGANEIVFVSVVQPDQPRFRLTYVRKSATEITGRFEIAQPGKSTAFAPYLTWTARRRP